jgi:hypothetical protein
MNSDSAVVMMSPTTGKSPDQRIEAEAHAGARDDEGGVKQGRKRVDLGNAGGTGAGARQVEVEAEAEAIGGGHGGPSSAAPDGDAGRQA